MKKQILIIGTVSLLICVGLSGCNQNKVGNIIEGITYIRDINGHPNRYIDHTVTIQGKFTTDSTPGYSDMGVLVDDNLDSINARNMNNVSKPEPFIETTAIYKFTGVIEYLSSNNLIYLRVTKIETT